VQRFNEVLNTDSKPLIETARSRGLLA